MTLAINVTLPEGMVFATDTRFTYRNRAGTARVGSDSMSKIVPLGSHMLVAFAGFPFLEQDGEQVSTLGLLQDFSQTVGAETSVDVVSERLLDLLREPFEAQYRKSINRQQAMEMLQLQGASQISIDELAGSVSGHLPRPHGPGAQHHLRQ